MGSRAERKQRKKEKIAFYVSELSKVLKLSIIKYASEDYDEQELLNRTKYDQKLKLFELIKKKPQEKNLILEANSIFVKELSEDSGKWYEEHMNNIISKDIKEGEDG